MTNAIHPVLRKTVRFSTALAIGLGLSLGIAGAASPAMAFGGDGGNSPVNKPVVAAPVQPGAKPVVKRRHKIVRKTASPLRVCRTGAVWSKTRKHCIKAASGALPDSDLLEQGRLLALAGHYRQALPVLDAIADKTHDPLVYTYIGYSYRKLGKTDTGIDYYMRALAVDPNSLNTHEYLGEGYVAQGKMELARAELAKVETLCGNRTCEQYADLANALAGKSED